MSQTMSKRDIIAVTASSAGAAKLHTLLSEMRADLIALASGTTLFHQGIDEQAIEGRANASDLPTAITLVNSLRTKTVFHLASAGTVGAHATASAQEITAPVATDLATAMALANDIKAKYNTHRTEASVHLNNDTTNSVSAADASDLGTLVTLANAIKVANNAHCSTAITAGYIQ
jgi:hypothetical protein